MVAPFHFSEVTGSLTRMKHAVRLIAGSVAITLSLGLAATAGAAAPAPVSSSTTHVISKSHRVIMPTKAAWARGVRNNGAVTSSNTSQGQLTYQGGIDGIGVTTGPPKVYLVFWGSQWGSTSATLGVTHLANDPSGIAPVLQKLYAGLGTNGETWSGVMTQYCESVSVGATSCPSSNSSHVGYPTGGALAGVWVDEGAAAPSSATGHQLAAEAVAAASHFGNTTALSNRNAQYVIVSPHGTSPDGFNTSGSTFCSWHDWNGDSSLSGGAAASTVGDVAFTNLPYLPDAGATCGTNYVNAGSAGLLDGVTLVASHEYGETLTDQNPAGGWIDAQGNENGDKCAWVGVGGTGGARNIALATGTFAVTGTWSNASASCAISAPIVTNPAPGNRVTLTNPGPRSVVVNTPYSLQLQATDSASAALTYSATGLPTGLVISPSTGLISGTPTVTGVSSVVARAVDSSGASASTNFTLSVTSPAPVVVVTNPGSQSYALGQAASLQIHATDSSGATLTYAASNLPAGLSLDATSGLLSGTPTAVGSFSVSVTASDAASNRATVNFTILITSTTAVVTIVNPGNQTATVGTRYALDLQATSTTRFSRIGFSVTGLPTGINLLPGTNDVVGIPTSAGSSTVTVTATDVTGASATATFTLVVSASSTSGCVFPTPARSGEHRSAVATTKRDGHGPQGGSSGSTSLSFSSLALLSSTTRSASVTLPAGCTTYTLSYDWAVVAPSAVTANATMTISLGTQVLATYTTADASLSLHHVSFDVSAFSGTTTTLTVTVTEPARPALPTLFLLGTPTFSIS